MTQVFSPTARFGMAMRFAVTIGGFNLGSWAKCSGLSVEFKNKKVTEGGNYDYPIYLPDKVEYKTIQLKRAISAKESAQLKLYLSSVVSKWYKATSPADYSDTAQIYLYDHEGKQVMTWELDHVYPARWSGPDLDATNKNIAIETLELVHQGFL